MPIGGTILGTALRRAIYYKLLRYVYTFGKNPTVGIRLNLLRHRLFHPPLRPAVSAAPISSSSGSRP